MIQACFHTRENTYELYELRRLDDGRLLWVYKEWLKAAPEGTMPVIKQGARDLIQVEQIEQPPMLTLSAFAGVFKIPISSYMAGYLYEEGDLDKSIY